MITAGRLRNALRTACVPLGLALSMLVLEVLGGPVRRALEFDRDAIIAGQGWRLISGHFVHLGFYHLVLNLIGLAALVLLSERRVSVHEWCRRLLVLSLATSAALLLFVPTLTTYVGLSGVMHGLFVLTLAPQAVRGDRLAQLALLYLFAKLLWEWHAGAPIAVERAVGGHVVTQAHLFGTLAAVVYGYAFSVFRRGEESQ